MIYYFYDLETSGVNPFSDRIMQFGGQKLDENFKPLAEVDEFYIRLSDDVLPAPGAILTHKILPQQSNLEGLTEYQFLHWLEQEVYKPGTVFTGYNIVAFDNLFMHWMHWRNFANPCPISKDGSTFDLYPMICMAYDLRPEGLDWPAAIANKNRPPLTLSAMAAANNLSSAQHTAASDVKATVALAAKVKACQPKLFDHCLSLNQTKVVKSIISVDKPFLHGGHIHLATGSYTTLAVVLAEHPTQRGCFIVYDLRRSPQRWLKMNAYDWSLRLSQWKKGESPAPVSLLKMNELPPVAPMSVLDQDSAKRLALDKVRIKENWQVLSRSNLAKTLCDAYLRISQSAEKRKEQSFERELSKIQPAADDVARFAQLRKANAGNIADLRLEFSDRRWRHLQFLYQARNFPKTLNTEQLQEWERYKKKIFLENKPSELDKFKRQLRYVLFRKAEDVEANNILEELQLYVETLLPQPDDFS